MKTSLVALPGLVLTFLGASTGSAQTPGHTMVTPGDLKWVDVPSLPPGAKLAVIQGPLNEAVPFTMRIKFPANYQIPAHSHPAIEHVTVMSGTFNIGMGDKLDRRRQRRWRGAASPSCSRRRITSCRTTRRPSSRCMASARGPSTT